MPARQIIEDFDEEREARRDHEEEPSPRKCPHCTGGRVAVEGGRAHHCTDCRGHGVLPDDDDDDEE
jgi:hypothetical protein